MRKIKILAFVIVAFIAGTISSSIPVQQAGATSPTLTSLQAAVTALQNDVSGLKAAVTDQFNMILGLLAFQNALSNPYLVESNVITVAPGSSGQAVADCNPGDILLEGGYEYSSTPTFAGPTTIPVNVFENNAILSASAESQEVSIYNPGSPDGVVVIYLKATAVCAFGHPLV